MLRKAEHPVTSDFVIDTLAAKYYDCSVITGSSAFADDDNSVVAGGCAMRVYHFSEQAYFPAWNEHSGTLRVTFPNRKCDPRVAADLFHRYYDEWQLCDELGLDIMLNEHHQTATCMSSSVVVGLRCWRASPKTRGSWCSAIRSGTGPTRCAPPRNSRPST